MHAQPEGVEKHAWSLLPFSLWTGVTRVTSFIVISSFSSGTNHFFPFSPSSFNFPQWYYKSSAKCPTQQDPFSSLLHSTTCAIPLFVYPLVLHLISFLLTYHPLNIVVTNMHTSRSYQAAHIRSLPHFFRLRSFWSSNPNRVILPSFTLHPYFFLFFFHYYYPCWVSSTAFHFLGNRIGQPQAIAHFSWL